MFHLWLISATGSVATEHPHPINAIFTESGCSRISSKNASRDFPRLHCIEKVKLSHLSKVASAICTSHKELKWLLSSYINHSVESIPVTVQLMMPVIVRNVSCIIIVCMWLCIASRSRSRPAFFRDMWFIDCSCIHKYMICGACLLASKSLLSSNTV